MYSEADFRCEEKKICKSQDPARVGGKKILDKNKYVRLLVLNLYDKQTKGMLGIDPSHIIILCMVGLVR